MALRIEEYALIGDCKTAALVGRDGSGMAPSERGRAIRPIVLDYLATAWRQPDEGIWEVRGGPQHFVHSKVMAWVAFDRAAKARRGRPAGR